MTHQHIKAVFQSCSKLQPELRLIFRCDRWVGAPHCWGGHKQTQNRRWVAADRDDYLLSCCTIMNQRSGQAQRSHNRWDMAALSFSSHSGAELPHDSSLTFLTFHPFGHSRRSSTSPKPLPAWFGPLASCSHERTKRLQPLSH